MDIPVERGVWEGVFRKNDQVVLREIADEILLVPVRGRLAQLQQLFVLNPVAHYIWQEIDGMQSLRSIHRGLVESFEVAPEEAQGDLLELIENLRRAGLIEPRDHAPKAEERDAP